MKTKSTIAKAVRSFIKAYFHSTHGCAVFAELSTPQKVKKADKPPAFPAHSRIRHAKSV